MKKVCMVLLLSLFGIIRIVAAPCGDVNGDGNVDIVDALVIAQHYVNLNPANFDPTVADVNGDGTIDIVDALLVAQYYVDLIDELTGCPDPDTPTPTSGTTPVPAEPQTVFAVNCGGSAYTASDGTEYAADTGYSGGTAYTSGSSVSGTSDPTLYSTERYGSCTYSASVPNGLYLVTLHFAENYHTSEGSRALDVVIEGTQVIDNLDIYREVGGSAALVIENQVAVNDGQINIEFVTVTENALINAIKVTQAGPAAAFSYSPDMPVFGQSIRFDASASTDPIGTITNYSWDFGDGSTGTGITANHAYSTSGNQDVTYDVTLSVSDDQGYTGSVTKPVTVYKGNPVADFTVSPPAAKPGDIVTVDASASFDPNGVIVSYQVNYGDGETGSGAVTTHSYDDEGVYTITVTVTDNDGQTDSSSKPIPIQDLNIDKLKPRVVVLTDISTWEHDDHESMTRFLVHADLFEIEAIMLTTGYSYDNADESVQMGILNGIINAYESDLPNLLKRSNQSGFAHDNGQQEVGYWPSANYVRNHSMMGSLNKYQSSIGSGNRNGGSDYLIDLALEDDERPVWITVWGGANTVCQMVWQIENDRPQDKARILQKLRLYTITDQDKHYQNGGDTCHDNMEPKVANDLLYIDDECAWTRHNSTGKSNWSQYQTHIQGHGNLGRQYPKYDYGVEGDTPSFLYCMPTGLNNPDDPSQCSWGGTYRHSGNNKWDPAGSCGSFFDRFYPAAFNNFAARMDWAANGSGNRNPVIKIDGDDGYRVMERNPRQGTTLTLDASETYDPDGNNLTFNWWVQTDTGSGNISIGNSSSSIATVSVPSGSAGNTYHVICEVKDNGTHNLSSYRRILIKPTN